MWSSNSELYQGSLFLHTELTCPIASHEGFCVVGSSELSAEQDRANDHENVQFHFENGFRIAN